MAQRKILVVFNCGQKNGSIFGRHLVKPASGQKIRLIYGHYRHKAGGASPLGVARAACFEQLAGHCQLRCHILETPTRFGHFLRTCVTDKNQNRPYRVL